MSEEYAGRQVVGMDLHRRTQPPSATRATLIHQHLAGSQRSTATWLPDNARTSQVASDVTEALKRGRNCLVLTQWTAHVTQLADALRHRGHDPVILRGGLVAKARAAALARLQPQSGGPPLLAVATGSYIGEGFDCPAQGFDVREHQTSRQPRNDRAVCQTAPQAPTT